MANPRVIAFDVNETLSDLSPLGHRFAEVGAPELGAQLWFARVLRDGFALAAGGGFAAFAEVGQAVLREMLPGLGVHGEPDAAVAHIMGGLRGLGVHPDVPAGVQRLSENGFRLVTLTNGSVEATQALLEGAGLRGYFERLLDVTAVHAWKPAAAPYRYAVQACAARPGEVMLVAVHPWDVDGAARAGLPTTWIDRTAASPYPAYFAAPDYRVTSLLELAERLGTAPSS